MSHRADFTQRYKVNSGPSGRSGKAALEEGDEVQVCPAKGLAKAGPSPYGDYWIRANNNRNDQPEQQTSNCENS